MQILPTEIICDWVCRWEAGKKPTIPEFVKRYPEHAEQIVDFVLRFIHKDNRRKNIVRTIQAKMKAVEVEQNGKDDYANERITLQAVYSDDPDNPNYTYSQATPQAELSMVINNPAAFGAFQQGREYLVNFQEVE